MLEQAISLHQKGQFAEAAKLYRKLLAQNPKQADPLHLLGVIEMQRGNFAEAVEMIGRAIALDPRQAAYFSNRAIALRALGRLEDALVSFDLAVALQPNYSDAHNNRGTVLLDMRRHQDALASFDRALTIKPDYSDALVNRGIALRGLKRLNDALITFDHALELSEDDVEALTYRAATLMDLDRAAGALSSSERALKIRPSHLEAVIVQGNALQAMNRFEEALAACDRALALKPDSVQALNNRGNALQSLKRYEEAADCYGRALALNPDSFEAFVNLGNALQGMKYFKEAVASFDRALALQPEHTGALVNRGNALRGLHRFNEALTSVERALVLKPDLVDALIQRGILLLDMRRLIEAIESFDRALYFMPTSVEALVNRGDALLELKRPGEAASCYGQALALAPETPFLSGLFIYCKTMMCDWAGFDEELGRLAEAIRQGRFPTPPLAVLGIPLTPELRKKATEDYARQYWPASTALPPIVPRAAHERIRIGYFSSDFREHPVAQSIAELIERHDRTQFEVYAISFGAHSRDAFRERFEKTFDRFFDVEKGSDREAALLGRALELDIAVDLNGFTQGARTGIFAMRTAPIQVSYLGYPGTMSTDYMDYLVADETVVPRDAQRDFAEKIAYVPGSFQIGDFRRPISDRSMSRSEFGLPEQGFVFCSFNNAVKIMPDMFAMWMRILGAVGGSVLWLRDDMMGAAQNLRSQAWMKGIAPERLVFAKRMDMAEHLARHRLADLFLDTLPYNAHTTAGDALYAGLPVLTTPGDSMAGRVGASLLNAAGMPELIAPDLAAYEEMAIALARDPARLAGLKERLAAQRLRAPLFDTAQTTRNIEAVYRAMQQRRQDGLPPDHIYPSV